MFKNKKPEEKKDHRKDGSFMSGALFGAIVGAALGVLYSPEKGAAIRKKLKKEADKFMDAAEPALKKAKPMIDKVKEEAGPLIAEAKEKITEALGIVVEEEKPKKRGRSKKTA